MWLFSRYFTKEYYEEIITNKTAYYTIFLPVYLGLVVTESPSEIMHSSEVKELCVLLGRYFQIRDDYLDAFADPSVLGKEGTDIQEGKCSWVILTVLSMCSEEDKIALKKLYGKNDPHPVRQIYAKYDVKSVFVNYENATLQKVRDILVSTTFPDARLLPFFWALVEKLFGRVWLVCSINSENPSNLSNKQATIYKRSPSCSRAIFSRLSRCLGWAISIIARALSRNDFPYKSAIPYSVTI